MVVQKITHKIPMTNLNTVTKKWGLDKTNAVNFQKWLEGWRIKTLVMIRTGRKICTGVTGSE